MGAYGPRQRPDWVIFEVPKIFWAVGILIATVALIPPAVVYYARTVPKKEPRIHLIQNMDNQPNYKAQQTNELFRDNRAMRPQVPGTVSRTAMIDDTHLWLGTVDGAFATTFPDAITVDRALLERGHQRFEIYCLPCHGVTGKGDGPVHHKAMNLLENGTNGTVWVQPRNLHDEVVTEQPPGKIFHTISNGLNNMPDYSSQIPVRDRWAIVAWIEALQVSRNAPADQVPGADALPEVRRVIEDEEDTPVADAIDNDAPAAHDHSSHDHGGGDS
jgi:mono/diheme cytochrome c family protein